MWCNKCLGAHCLEDDKWSKPAGWRWMQRKKGMWSCVEERSWLSYQYPLGHRHLHRRLGTRIHSNKCRRGNWHSDGRSCSRSVHDLKGGRMEGMGPSVTSHHRYPPRRYINDIERRLQWREIHKLTHSCIRLASTHMQVLNICIQFPLLSVCICFFVYHIQRHKVQKLQKLYEGSINNLLMVLH